MQHIFSELHVRHWGYIMENKILYSASILVKGGAWQQVIHKNHDE